MKTFIKITTLMLMILSMGITQKLQAQTPDKMSYQAVIRDGSDNLITSSNVGMRIQILQGSEFGAAVYVETHTPSTNANGLVSIQVGEGNVVSGDFTSIDWANGSYYIKNEIDPTGGTNYSITGTSELLSVPYALHAKTSASPIPGPQGPQGNDGNGIASTTDNGDGTFTFTYDDGSTFTTSDLTGPQGSDGNGIASTTDNGDGTFTFTYDDGSTFTTSNLTGPQGNDGNGIASTTDNGDGTFTFTYDDGSTFTTSDLSGPQGNGFDDGTANGNTIFWDGTGWIENDLLYNDGSKIGIGNTNPKASFHVGGTSAEDGILVTGSFNQGQDLSISGAGTRLFFYPKKAAFRAGHVNANQWDNAQIGEYSSAWGANTEASGDRSTAWGTTTEASGGESTAWGHATSASGSVSTAWGDVTSASGSFSTAWGEFTQASGARSTAWGNYAEALGEESTAWGNFAEASGVQSTAWGDETVASGDRSTAWGNNTTASGNKSTAFGRNTVASGAQSTVWGFGTEASGNKSTAFGRNTVASGAQSTVWGFGTEASGVQSTAWGQATQASGGFSTAWGDNTEASGDKSTAWGDHISAKSGAETALGRYNTNYTPSSIFWNADDRLFGIGNGTSYANRSDAMVVLKNGNTGIGLSNPQHRLAVKVNTNTTPNGDGLGIVNVDNSNYWNVHMSTNFLRFSYNNNNVSHISQSSGAYVQTSDRSLKENIKPLTQNVLDKLQQINVVQYNYKRDKTKTQTTGVIAQELKELFPDFVHQDGKNDKMGVNYAGLSLVAIQGIQEQQQQIDKLEAENKNQQEQLDKLESKIKILEQKMNSIIKSN